MSLMGKRLLKSLLPRKIQEIVKVYRTHEAAQDVNLQLERLEQLSFELGPQHVANTKVYPGRSELLSSFPTGAECAEVGVAEGEFSETILSVCHPRRLHLIDMWGSSDIDMYSEKSMRMIQSRYASQIADGRVVIRRGCSWETIAQLENQSLDFIYIDADHSYESVKKDLLAARVKIKPGGIIAGHDYVKWSGAISRFGVVEAVNEFCIHFNYELIGLTVQRNMHLSFAIREIK